MNVDVKTSGPIFESDLPARLTIANIRASNEVGPKLADALRAAYSGGIVRRGPGRYGHLADTVRWATQVQEDVVATRVLPQGRAAFKAIFLEKGHPGPYKGGASGILLPRERRDRAARRRGHAAALKIGSIFRRSAQPRPAPAFHVIERVLEQQWPSVAPVFTRELAKETGGTVGT